MKSNHSVRRRLLSIALTLTFTLMLTIAPMNCLFTKQAYAEATVGNWTDYKAASYAGGSGTAADPFLISNEGELALAASQVNAEVGISYLCFKLTANIDMNGHNWVPIGTVEKNYGGTFDGDGHSVNNLTCDVVGATYKGFFGEILSAGVIKDLYLKNINISGSISGTVSNVGGLADANFGTVTNCYVSGNLLAQGAACGNGGLVGANFGTISNCYSKVNVTSQGTGGNNYTGGLVGANFGGTIINSYATGNVNASASLTGADCGGLAGYNGFSGSKVRGTIANCYATGDVVNGANTNGGLVGFNKANISNCYATGNNYATSNNNGGFIGWNTAVGVINNCYYVNGATGIGKNEGAGTPVKQPKDFYNNQSNYATSLGSWDFASIWGIDPSINGNLPYLKAIKYSVTFKVTDGTNAVSGAVVTLDGTGEETTNAKGQAVFNHITNPSSLNYGVTAAGFQSTTGTVSIASDDVTKDVALTVPVTGIALDQKALTLHANGTASTLTAVVKPANATNKGVTWSTDNSSVAKVSDGVVTPLAAGSAIITVTTADGSWTDTCTVTVVEPVTGVVLDKSSLSLNVGGVTGTLTATVNPANATNKNVIWSIDHASVATVNDGAVTPLSAGTATITVTTADGAKTAVCTVTVVQLVTEVKLDKASLTLNEGGATGTLVATVNPTNATNKNVTWTSSDIKVVKVADGVVTSVSTGSAIITVTTVEGNKTDTCMVTVVQPVTGVVLDYKTMVLTAGAGSGTLIPTISPVNAIDKNVSWNSSNPSVATVVNGVVKPLSAGTTTITVKTSDGNKTDHCVVTVIQASSPGTGTTTTPTTDKAAADKAAADKAAAEKAAADKAAAEKAAAEKAAAEKAAAEKAAAEKAAADKATAEKAAAEKAAAEKAAAEKAAADKAAADKSAAEKADADKAVAEKAAADKAAAEKAAAEKAAADKAAEEQAAADKAAAEKAAADKAAADKAAAAKKAAIEATEKAKIEKAKAEKAVEKAIKDKTAADQAIAEAKTILTKAKTKATKEAANTILESAKASVKKAEADQAAAKAAKDKALADQMLIAAKLNASKALTAKDKKLADTNLKAAMKKVATATKLMQNKKNEAGRAAIIAKQQIAKAAAARKVLDKSGITANTKKTL